MIHRTSLRMSPELRSQIELICQRDQTTLAAVIRQLLNFYLGLPEEEQRQILYGSVPKG